VQLDLPEVTVPPGQEVQVCRFLKLPSDTDFFFDHVQMETTAGGRHLYVMKSEYFDFPDDFHPDCFAPVDTNTWAVVVNSQTRHLDWTLPQGVAFHLHRRTQLMVQAHYYNTGPSPIAGRATVNLWQRDAAQVEHWANVVTAVYNNIHLAPGASMQVTQHCTLPVDTAETAPQNRIHPVHILALTGDFHRAGRQYGVRHFHLDQTGGCPPTCPGTEDDPVYYSNQDGMNPPFQTFSSGSEPQLPNADGFSFTCAYQNDSAETVSFGPRVLTQEHCNMFVYFWPAPMDGMTLGCVEVTGAW
jgi:hypothetical protein